MQLLSPLQLQTTERILKQLGLIESEIFVFLLGLEQGPLTISQIAEISNMGRITVHEIIGRLIKKGIFLQSLSGKKRIVYPNSVDALERMLDEKKLALEYLEKDLHKTTALLRSIQTQSENFPKMRFFKGKEGIAMMLAEIANDKMHVKIMSDGQHFYDLIDNNFLEQSLSIRKKHKLHIQMIFPTGFEYFSYTQGSYQQQLDIKALPEEQFLKGGCTIRGKKIAFHCYEGKFITTTIMENAPIAQIQGFLFDTLWGVAKNY